MKQLFHLIKTYLSVAKAGAFIAGDILVLGTSSEENEVGYLGELEGILFTGGVNRDNQILLFC